MEKDNEEQVVSTPAFSYHSHAPLPPEVTPDQMNVCARRLQRHRRRLQSLSGCSLSGCSLSGCSLSGCSLSGCSLSEGLQQTFCGVLHSAWLWVRSEAWNTSSHCWDTPGWLIISRFNRPHHLNPLTTTSFNCMSLFLILE